MLNNVIFEIFIYYVLQENNFKILNNLRLTCNEYNNIIENDIYYQRKKNAYLLHNTLNKLYLEFIIYDFVDYKHLKYMLNNIYNIYTNNAITYTNYKFKLNFYKYDNLNPLKYLPIFKKNQIKERMNSRILLNMALDHAEKEISYNLVREIYEYY